MTPDTDLIPVTVHVPKPPKGWVVVSGNERLPKEGELNLWLCDGMWVESKTVMPYDKYRALAFPAPKPKRLLTPAELAGKWLHHPLGDSLFIVRFCEGFVWVGDADGGISVKECVDVGYTYSDTPAGEKKPLEIEDDK